MKKPKVGNEVWFFTDWRKQKVRVRLSGKTLLEKVLVSQINNGRSFYVDSSKLKKEKEA